MTTAKLIETYEQDVARKRELIDRSRTTHDHLLLITEGLRRLSLDERFVALVEDENLATLPAVLSDRINDYQKH